MNFDYKSCDLNRNFHHILYYILVRHLKIPLFVLLLWNTYRHQESVPFVSKVQPSGPWRTSVHDLPPRPALTDFWNNRLEESVPFVSKVHPSGPSRTSVHDLPPWPSLTDFWNNRREESVPFVSKVHSGGPSRTSVTARSHELLKQTAPHTAGLSA